MSHRIEQLLRDADDYSAAATPSHNLADRVWRQFLVRRFRRRVFVTTAACALFAFTVGIILHHSTPSPMTASHPLPGPTIIARYVDDPAVVVDRVMSSARLARAEEKLSQLRLAISRENPTDRAAYVIVFRADRLADSQSDKRVAEKSYRDVIQLFPDSSAAQLAQQRLQKIQKEIQS